VQLPAKSSLPLTTEDVSFLVDSTKIDEFHKAFRDRLTYTPPTLMAIAMRGIFDQLNAFEIDWKNLLHATQSFTYHQKLVAPVTVLARTSLVDIKFRASIHWLNFEVNIRDAKTEEALITSKSLLMIRQTP
jgi:hypothetical protein